MDVEAQPAPAAAARSRGPRRFVAAALLALAVLGLIPAVSPAAQNVLLVFDEDKDLPGLAAINRGLRDGLRAEFKDDLVFYTESLQLSQFREGDYHGVLPDYLQRKYRDRTIDLVVAVMEPTLDFLLQHRDTLFSGVPILFCGVDSADLEGRTLPGDVTGVTMKRAFAPTVEIALNLQPDTRHVYVIGGSSRFDQKMQAIARRDLQSLEQRASITWLTSLPMDELLGQVSKLPRHSVIFYLTLFTDGAGRPYVTHDALRRINEAANAPVYVSVDQYLGTGAVGGSVYSVHSLGQEAARLGARILRGEPPSAIPPVALSAYVPMFDWRQLRRWHLDAARLPANSMVQFRALTVWQTYKWYILGGVTLLLLQTALVIGLLVNRAQRRRAEQARLESEERRRRAEEDVQRQRDQLAHALRLTTLGELTASISHELNQPLTAIAANAQAAQKLLELDPENPDVDEALEDLVSDSIRAAEIIRRLQALFRKKPAAQAVLDLNAVIEDVLHLLASDLRNRQMRVHFIRSNSLPKVMGDGIQLRQVIINLLRNAEDAIAQAGSGPREIRIVTNESDEARVGIEIRDSGTGVADEELERIFEHFVSSKAEGLGMGLAISRSIIEAHGGRIWATRNEDRGLTLHLHLPAIAQVQMQQAETERAGAVTA